jgi:drug/metabolite transporter (DMT)-like permease
MKSKMWLVYAVITMVFWGVWGALIEIPEQAGFPATLGYSVWALTMIIPSVFVLRMVGWKLDTHPKAIIHGLIIGFLGAGGQLILFHALVSGPAYLIFPFISLSPLVTIILSYFMLKERANTLGWIGIGLAVIAIPLLSYQTPETSAEFGYIWIFMAVLVLFAWGIQAFFMKIANIHMRSESIFFYMTLTGLLLIPIALFMTDFSADINWGLSGPYATAAIMILNSVGALMLVYAFRYGKAIIVSPLTNAGAPVITIIISLTIYAVIPHFIIIIGMVMAVTAVTLMARAEAEADIGKEEVKVGP